MSDDIDDIVINDIDFGGHVPEWAEEAAVLSVASVLPVDKQED